MPGELVFPTPPGMVKRRRRRSVAPPRASVDDLVFNSRSTNPDHVRIIGYDRPHAEDGREPNPLIVLEIPRWLVDDAVVDAMRALLVRAGVAITVPPVLTVVR